MKFFSALFLLIPFLILQSNFEEIKPSSNNDITSISIEQIEELAKLDDKKIIVKLSAQWCKPCKKLSKTLGDSEVQNYLNNNFHVIDFDIQTKETIRYKGKSYAYVDDPKMGYHTLAFKLLEERLSFPALLVLDTNLQKIDLTRGYKSKSQLLDYLKEI